MKPPRETRQSAYLVARLRRAGCLVLRTHAHGQQSPGWPDLIVAMPCGIVLWIELKAGGGKLRPVQAAVIRDLRARGHRAFVLRDLTTVSDADGREEEVPFPLEVILAAKRTRLEAQQGLSNGSVDPKDRGGHQNAVSARFRPPLGQSKEDLHV